LLLLLFVIMGGMGVESVPCDEDDALSTVAGARENRPIY
jgi:hypothetical protein